MAEPWEKIGVIAGVISLVVAVITLVSGIFLPEIRCLLELELNNCSSSPTPPQDSTLKSYFIEIIFLHNRDDLWKEATDIRIALIERGFNPENVALQQVSESTLQALEVPKSNEVRFDVGPEGVPATDLKRLLEEIVSNKTFNLRDANNPEPTQNYISIFLWP